MVKVDDGSCSFTYSDLIEEINVIIGGLVGRGSGGGGGGRDKTVRIMEPKRV